MITITGATGQLGSSVIDFLIKKGCPPSKISALARNEEKAKKLLDAGINVKYGNYDDYGSLVKAFTGTNTLLLISGNEMEKRNTQQMNAVRAAESAGVRHILYTSIQRQSDTPDSPINFVLNSHIDTENAIRGTKMNYTFLRNNLYMDMLPWVLGPAVFETGIFYPAKEGKIAYTLRTDMAEAIANILLSSGHENKEYNISNPHSLSFAEVAAELSAIAGKQVPYISPSVEDYKTALTSTGVPAFAADMLAGFAIGGEKGELVAGDTDLVRLLGHEPVDYKTFLKQLYLAN